LLPAIILGKKSMMYSQTLGPFKNPLNRLAARLCLARMDFIVPRGIGSLTNVQALNLPNKDRIAYFADSAFTLVVPKEVEESITNRYSPWLQGKKVVGISVNSIVQEKCKALGIAHDETWAAFIDYLQDQGYHVMLIPHSMRQNVRSLHNNDLLVIAAIEKMLKRNDRIMAVKEPYNCKELRVLVGLCDYYVASRFHSMISALCTGVPVLVFGWGHQKYREVLEEFQLQDYCYDAADLSLPALTEGFNCILRDADAMKEKMTRNLPAVQASSMLNHETAWRLASK
jgi:colanic acid/amylovoran biosynthesis protein